MNNYLPPIGKKKWSEKQWPRVRALQPIKSEDSYRVFFESSLFVLEELIQAGDRQRVIAIINTSEPKIKKEETG